VSRNENIKGRPKHNKENKKIKEENKKITKQREAYIGTR
jgi:hypothetical protein